MTCGCNDVQVQEVACLQCWQGAGDGQRPRAAAHLEHPQRVQSTLERRTVAETHLHRMQSCILLPGLQETHVGLVSVCKRNGVQRMLRGCLSADIIISGEE
jgi:hypothetical protein